MRYFFGITCCVTRRVKRYHAIILIKSSLLFMTITVPLKMAFNRMPGPSYSTRQRVCVSVELHDTQVCGLLAAFRFFALPLLSLFHNEHTRRAQTRLAHLVSCRAKVCIQSRRSEGLQYDIKRSISRMAIASLRRHGTPTLSRHF